jgi:hypothetical protein
LQATQESREASLSFRIVRGQIHEHPDAPQSFALLRARRERHGGRNSNACDEIASSHRLPQGLGPRQLHR